MKYYQKLSLNYHQISTFIVPLYSPKISHHSNYERFLQLFHGRTSSLSEDEAGNLSGNEGFIEDEMVDEMTIVEEGMVNS